MTLQTIAQTLSDKGFDAKLVNNKVEVSLTREIFVSEVLEAVEVNRNQVSKEHTHLIVIR